MPFSDEDFVPLQEATAHGTGTSVAVSLPGGTTEGMTVLIHIYSLAGFQPSVIATGFISDGGRMYRRSNVAAAETGPWTFTLAGSADWVYYAMEVDNLDLVDPFDITVATGGTNANGTTRSTGTTPAAIGSESVAFAFFNATKVGASDVQSWSGWTNGFTEVLEYAPAGGSTGMQVAVARKYVSGFVTSETTATFATTSGTPTTRAVVNVYRAAGSTINAPIHYLTGFEFGTHGGLANVAGVTAAGSPLGAHATGTGTIGVNFIVQAGSARNGGHGLRLVASASNPGVDFANFAGTALFVTGFNIRPISATGQATMAVMQWSGVTLIELVYDSSTDQFGVGFLGETVSWQTGTTPLNTWAWVEMRVRANSSVHHVDWWIETGTGDGHQTSPTDRTGQSVATSLKTVLGCVTNETFTADYDDVVMSRHSAAYPLGPHVVRLLVPETTGATVSGTSGNFSKFTANGTLAAWAGDAGALLDEAPPTVSASSDGVVQTAVAASEYMNFPMTTYALAPNEIIAGARALASLWGGTGSGTGTLGFRGHDGTTETTFVAAGTSFDPDSLTAISATYPLWYSGMWNPGAKWTQAKLDAAALRGGFSTDATPDMGFSAMYLEVATRTIAAAVVAHRLTSDEDPEAVAAVVTETLHPYSSGVRTYTVSNDDATRTAEFNYSIGGTPQTPVTVAPTDPPEDVTVGAEAFGEVDSTSFGWQ